MARAASSPSILSSKPGTGTSTDAATGKSMTQKHFADPFGGIPAADTEYPEKRESENRLPFYTFNPHAGCWGRKACSYACRETPFARCGLPDARVKKEHAHGSKSHKSRINGYHHLSTATEYESCRLQPCLYGLRETGTFIRGAGEPFHVFHPAASRLEAGGHL